MLRLLAISLLFFLWGCHHNVQPETHSSYDKAMSQEAPALMADFAHRY